MLYLIKYTRFGIIKNTFIITILIFYFSSSIFAKTNQKLIEDKSYIYEILEYENNPEKLKEKLINEEDKTKEITKNVIETEQEKLDINISKITNEEKLNKEIWEIEIPIINLKAKIAEGTDQTTMNKYVGHFENTSIYNGNVGLAGHNRGYTVNYFSNIKDLKIGDQIIYKTKYGTRKYKVDNIKIIEDDNWSYLNFTQENRITLITCVENEPSYRRCIQGIEEVEYEKNN